MPISVCLMEEELPKFSDLCFCIFTSRCYGCVLCAMRSCGHSAFFSLGWLWDIAHCPGSSFQVFALPLVMDESLGRRGMGRAQQRIQNPSEGLLSSKQSKNPAPIPLDLLSFPTPCPTPLDVAAVLDYSVTSLLVSTSCWNLLYF